MSALLVRNVYVIITFKKSRSVHRQVFLLTFNYFSFRHRQVFYTPTVSRRSGSKVRRMFSMSHKSPPPKVPQPDRVDEVYNALKKGLG